MQSKSHPIMCESDQWFTYPHSQNCIGYASQCTGTHTHSKSYRQCTDPNQPTTHPQVGMDLQGNARKLKHPQHTDNTMVLPIHTPTDLGWIQSESSAILHQALSLTSLTHYLPPDRGLQCRGCCCAAVAAAAVRGWLPLLHGLHVKTDRCRDGQNCIYTTYTTIYLVISLSKIPYIHRTYSYGQPWIYVVASLSAKPETPMPMFAKQGLPASAPQIVEARKKTGGVSAHHINQRSSILTLAIISLCLKGLPACCLHKPVRLNTFIGNTFIANLGLTIISFLTQHLRPCSYQNL